MNFQLNGSELDIILISLIGRRNSIKALLTNNGMMDNYYAGYRDELSRVENLLEKFFPGSLKSMEKVA